MFEKQRTNSVLVFKIQPVELNCPPRIIGKGSSIWFNDSEKKSVGYDRHSEYGIIVYREGGFYYLIQIHVKKKSWEEHFDGSILLNGYPVYEKQQLKDGDFMLIGNEPAIFQVDPTGDKLRYSKNAIKREEPLVLPTYLKKVITIDGSGITFNKARASIKWWEIETIFVERVSHRARLSVMSTSLTNKHLQLILKDKDLAILGALLVSYSPIDLSVFSLSSQPSLLQDGYKVVAQYKIIDPSDMARKALPASREIILGQPTEDDLRLSARRKKCLYMGLVIIMVVIALIDIRLFAAILFITFCSWSLRLLFPFSK
ncbi:MAG: hypothetical protein ABI947_04795 [Chloroflexota bacterium]